MFSLLDEPWIAVIYRDGRQAKIKPEQIADQDIIELNYPRADFQGAAYQWLIGLLQTTFVPEDEIDWEDHYQQIPSSSTLQQVFTKVTDAMQFRADKPSFMQDFESLATEPTTIAGLLIEAPGGNTLKLNKDHFIKRDTVAAICPHCAVLALFTLQINAPSGGQGHRTGMRGGGPITTLVMPDLASDCSLWHKLWLNVMPQEVTNRTFDDSVFPWLAATKTSEPNRHPLTPENAHPLQAYWGMPRRIELDFATTHSGHCDLCGQQHDQLLSQYRTKNYGVQYEGWTHPLSPYRQAIKAGSPLLSVKGQPGGLVYKDWLGLISQSHDQFNNCLPAKIVMEHAKRSRQIRAKTGLWCFGYDMDNMKARCWYEHRFPLLLLAEPIGEEFNDLINLMLDLATNSLTLLRSAISEAQGNSYSLATAYWQETESEFLHLAHQLLLSLSGQAIDRNSLFKRWRDYLGQYIFSAFMQRVLNDVDNHKSIDAKAPYYLKLRRLFFAQKPLKAMNISIGKKQADKDI